MRRPGSMVRLVLTHESEFFWQCDELIASEDSFQVLGMSIIKMNDVMASTMSAERGHEDEQTSLAGWTLLLAWLTVALGLGVGVWISFRETRQISGLACLLPAAAGGALALLLIMAGARKVCRASLLTLRGKEVNWQKMFSGLQVQLAESRRSEELSR